MVAFRSGIVHCGHCLRIQGFSLYDPYADEFIEQCVNMIEA